MEKITAITEAFSMQPRFISILTEEEYESYYSKPKALKEIKLEGIHIGGEQQMFYVGYNFDGKKIFQYLANSVNVHFE